MSLFYYFITLLLTSIIFFVSGCTTCTTNRLILQTDKIISKFENVQIFKKNYDVFNILKIHHINIQQGNFISREMVMRLKKGMTRDQVRFILGTSLLSDIFHANRWDYQFSFVKVNGDFITSCVSIFFKHDLLDYYEGEDALLTEQEYLSLIIKQ